MKSLVAVVALSMLTLLPASAADTQRSDGAVLRALDKLSSETTDIALDVGEQASFGRLQIRLGECRYPAGDPNSDAFAQLVISDVSKGQTVFDGWMVASSPALSALDDPRYDVWVISCKI